MNATKQLHELGQSLWLDNITRGLLDSGTLKRYLHDFRSPDLRPTRRSSIMRYETRSFMTRRLPKRPPGENQAKTCFSTWRWKTCPGPPISFALSMTRPRGVDGWVSLEVSPRWPTTRRGQFEKPHDSTPARRDPISSSRFPAPLQDSRQ